jgi:hypothetical protein
VRGPFGIPHDNFHGRERHAILGLHQLALPTTFSVKLPEAGAWVVGNIATHRRFGTIHAPKILTGNRSTIFCQAKRYEKGSRCWGGELGVESDHRAISLRLDIGEAQLHYHEKPPMRADCTLLQDPEKKKEWQEVGLYEVDGDFYGCERDGRRGDSRSSATSDLNRRWGQPAYAPRGPPPQVSVAPALRTPCATTPERGLLADRKPACAHGCERKEAPKN